MEMTSEKKREMETPVADAHAESVLKQEQRKKRKLEKAEAMESGQWERCMFKVVRKNRFCNNARIAGSEYCGNHVPADTSAHSKKSQQYKAELRVRVPCPIDGSHSVYKYDLEKHARVCNKLREAAIQKSLPYYSENINSGTHDKTTNAQSEPDVEAEEQREEQEAPQEETSKGEEKQQHSGPSEQQEQGLIDRLAAMDFAGLTARINAAFDRCVGDIPLQKRYHKCCDPLLAEKTAAKSSKNVIRHIEQQASILGNMEELQLLDSAAAFLELGAGRGMLSLAMAQALPDNLYVLIDRAGGRGKADHFIRDGATDQKQAQVIRAKIDIRHLNLAGMPELDGTPIVGMSKHLCGVATDLSLRCLHTLPATPSAGGLSPYFKGVAVALCCHHACNWADYVNPTFFLEQDFTADEFKLVAAMTSWATCAMKLGGDSVAHVLGVRQPDRAVLGRKCKRILDAGRVQYLQQLGLNAKLVHYCDVSESVENCLLLAWRS